MAIYIYIYIIHMYIKVLLYLNRIYLLNKYFFPIFIEGSLIKSCEKSVTTVTSGSFKYFRTKFSFVTGNRVSVEVRDKKGRIRGVLR